MNIIGAESVVGSSESMIYRRLCLFLISFLLLGFSAKLFAVNLYEQSPILETQSETSVAFNSFQNKFLVLSFIFTNCPEACPMQILKLKRTQDALNETDFNAVHFLSISIDPDRDTPKALSDYAAQFNANLNHWTFARVPDQDLNYFSNAISLGLNKLDNLDHKMLVLLINKQGEILQHYSGTRFNPKRLASDIQSLISIQ